MKFRGARSGRMAGCLILGAATGGAVGILWVGSVGRADARAESGRAIELNVGVNTSSVREVAPRVPAEQQDVHERSVKSTAIVPAASPISDVAPRLVASRQAEVDVPARQWVHANPDSAIVCGADMQLVDADYCRAVEHNCVEPFADGSGRCLRYAPKSRCLAPSIAKRFCIDRYEFPNRAGEKPLVMVDFEQAQKACSELGKRLCTASEWTLACEGRELFPYPNGFERIAGACNVDQPHRFPDLEKLANEKTQNAEVLRLDQRTRSGQMQDCVSPFGVFDMTGNVDEWVTSDDPVDHPRMPEHPVLKGGYFGPVRARCRPETTSHGPKFKFFQLGFRCCATPSAARADGADESEAVGNGRNGGGGHSRPR